MVAFMAWCGELNFLIGHQLLLFLLYFGCNYSLLLVVVGTVGLAFFFKIYSIWAHDTVIVPF